MSIDEAMLLVQPGARAVASPGCGSPTTLLRGLAGRSHDVPIELYSGLQIDGYPFLDVADLDSLQFRTWHVMGPVRDLVERGVVGYVPARGSEVPALLEQWGADVTLLRVSPVDRHGFHHLGPSASYPLPSARRTPLVIAEIDQRVPRTYGTAVHESQITATVPSELPMPVYAADEGNGVTAQIAEHVLGLLPARPTLQLGIGAIPEALTAALLDHECGPLRFAGMATDSMVDLHEAGRLDTTALVPEPAILAAELMGGPRLMAFAHENPLVGVHPSTWSHDALALGAPPPVRQHQLGDRGRPHRPGQRRVRGNASSVGRRGQCRLRRSGVPLRGRPPHRRPAVDDIRRTPEPHRLPPRPWRRGHGVAKHSRRRRDGARRCRAAGPHAGRTARRDAARRPPRPARRPRSSDH